MLMEALLWGPAVLGLGVPFWLLRAEWTRGRRSGVTEGRLMTRPGVSGLYDLISESEME